MGWIWESAISHDKIQCREMVSFEIGGYKYLTGSLLYKTGFYSRYFMIVGNKWEFRIPPCSARVLGLTPENLKSFSPATGGLLGGCSCGGAVVLKLSDGRFRFFGASPLKRGHLQSGELSTW